MRYQVIVTKKDGVIYGSSFNNPVEALKHYSKMLKEDHLEVMFHEVCQLVCTLDTPYIDYGVAFKTQNGKVFVEIHTRSTLEDMKKELQKYQSQYQRGIAGEFGTSEYSIYPINAMVVDMHTAQEVLGFDSGNIYEF